MNPETNEEHGGPRRQAHGVLALLFTLMLFDFIDRQVLSGLLPLIKSDWALSDTQLGALVSSVNVAIAIAALPTAILVDRWSRSKCISVMAVIWSLATGAGALSGSFVQLLSARFFVGAGEAGYGAGGNALLSAMYPRRLRSTVIGIFQSATMLGSVLGVVLGGYIGTHWGWRHAFGIVAVPGFALAVLVYFVRDYTTVPVQVVDEKSGGVREAGALQVLLMILGSPVLWLTFIGQSAQLFFVSTLGNWLPSFFSRVHGLGLGPSTVHTGIVILTGAVGAALGGYVTDKITGGKAQYRCYGAAVFALLTAVFFILAFALSAGTRQSSLLCAGALCMSAVLGPMMSAVIDFVPTGMRTSASGAMITVTNLLGMALGPTVGGILSDRFDLQTALLMVSFMPLLAAACYAWAGIAHGSAKATRQAANTVTA